MKVVITGAAGFLGSHLTDRYLADGHQVVGIDNLLTGDAGNLEAALTRSRFSFLQADVVDPSWITSTDVIDANLFLHFASPASPVDYAQLPLQTLAVNSRGTENCCEAALAQGARLLYASTSEAYGDPREHPQKETYWGNVNPVGPRACYDESKRFGEALVTSYARARDLDARIIRIFNTYGPRMRAHDGRVVPNFICQALAQIPLTLFGEGKQTRSFCYVDDLVEGIVRCAASESTRGTVTNLGNPEEHTIKEFAEIICGILGIKPRYELKPMPENDPARRCPDIARARALLDWQPVVSLETGLRKTIDYFKVQQTPS